MDAPDRVLVGIDSSPLATDALEYALAIFPESEITALNVIVPLDSPMSEGGVLGGVATSVVER
jgi:nucleotide-binding universal stress UspA family protein